MSNIIFPICRRRNDRLTHSAFARAYKIISFPPEKTRGIGDFCSYQSSPSSGPSPQPSSTVARSSTQSAVPSSPSPVSPAGTLRQPSHFQQQAAAYKSWAPVTPPATSPLSQPPLLPTSWSPSQQQQQAQPGQVSDAGMTDLMLRKSEKERKFSTLTTTNFGEEADQILGKKRRKPYCGDFCRDL